MKDRPRYQPDTDKLYTALRERINHAIPQPHADCMVSYIKALALLVFFASCLVGSYHADDPRIALGLTMLAGFATLPLVLNIGHEAVHGNFSSRHWVNRLGRQVFFLLGTSAYLWEMRHLSAHHALPNVTEWDMDIEQTSVIRLADHQSHKAHHKYQHLYMPIAFCFYTLIWFFIRDFADLRRQSFGLKIVDRHPRREVWLLALAKVFHLTILIVIPYLMHGSILAVAAGFLLFHFSASIATTFVLISTHVGEPQEVIDGHEGQLPYTFLEHQLRTTADFATKSWFITELFGGFNHHVAHHLFPHLPHRHSKVATEVVQAFAADHDLPYHSFDNLLTTAISHSKRLRMLAVEI